MDLCDAKKLLDKCGLMKCPICGSNIAGYGELCPNGHSLEQQLAEEPNKKDKKIDSLK